MKLSNLSSRLNKRIEVFEYVKKVNEKTFETVQEEKSIGKLWAEIMDTRGLIQEKDVVDDVKYNYKIRIRYNKKLNETMVIKYQDRKFKINHIIDVNFNHVEMILLAEEMK